MSELVYLTHEEEEGSHPLAPLIREGLEVSRETRKALADALKEFSQAAAAMSEAARGLREIRPRDGDRLLISAERPTSVGQAIARKFAEPDMQRSVSNLASPGMRVTMSRLIDPPLPLADAVKATWTLGGPSGLANLVPREVIPALPPLYPTHLVDYIVAAGAVITADAPVSVVQVAQGGLEGFGDFQVVGEGGSKPEQPAPALTMVDLTPQFIAGYFALSRSMMRGPQMRVTEQLIERFWRRALYRALARAIIGGSGLPIVGILDTPGIDTYNQPATGGVADEPDARTLITAMGRLEDALFVPRVIISRPSVKYRVLGQMDATRQFISMSWPDILKEIPWIAEPSVPENVVIVADITAETLMLLEYSGITITMSTEHADFFARNLVAVRVEWEGNFAVLQPRAFCRVNLAETPWSPSA
ncbi:MAG: phage major capsid protein [Anaerolineae bacterium]|nr:phage major capsid protein [Anaerolineae bacterium]